MSLSIKLRLMVSFAIIILFLFTVGMMGLSKMKAVNSMMEEVSSTIMPGVKYIMAIDKNTSDYKAAVRQYILSTNDKDKEAADSELAKSIRELGANKQEYEKVITTTEDKELYDQFNSEWENYLRMATQAIMMSRYYNEEASSLLSGEVMQSYSNAQKTLSKIVELNERKAEERYSKSRAQYNSAVYMVVSVTIIAGAAGLILAFTISRDISGGLARIAERARLVAAGDLTAQDISIRGRDEIAQLSSAFNQMKNNLKDTIYQLVSFSNALYSAATKLSGQAQQTSAGACETVSTVEQMASTVENVAQNYRNVSLGTEEAAKNADEGTRGIDRIYAQMDSIISTTNITSQVINGLSDTSGRVSQIVDMISQIADQTNLLALNAAIEAARAGDQGRGFAVVADEVRKLAEQTTGAAKEINKLISQVQQESMEAVKAMDSGRLQVEDSVVVVNNVGNKFKGIIAIVEDLAQQVRSLAAASGEISSGIKMVVLTTENQTAAMEEVSAAAQELNTMAAGVDKLVKNFKV
ncbi:MAG: methyl-accepting chemotaxis protein [Bacillota bacterium]